MKSWHLLTKERQSTIIKSSLPFTVLILGFALRLILGFDIEYKADEIETMNWVEQVGLTQSWPWVGQNSSNGLRHPGLGMWIFIWFGQLFNVTTPVGLARISQIFNCLALGLLLYFIRDKVPKPERESWIWAFALICVNPLSMILERKIWHPSLLPLFVMFLIYGWWCRENKWSGSFLWGLFGALLGQIHMSGFYFSLALLTWTAAFDVKRRLIRWTHWLAGSILGAIPMLPWFLWVIQNHQSEPMKLKLHRLVMFKFWNYWFSQPLGLVAQYSLGSDFFDFLRYPIIGGQPLYLVGASHLLLIAITIFGLIKLIGYIKAHRNEWPKQAIGRESQSAFLVAAGLWGCGFLVTASAINIERYFHLALWPIPFLWLARFFLLRVKGGQKFLAALFGLQLLISASLLGYVHIKGHIAGDFGPSYRIQVQGR